MSMCISDPAVITSMPARERLLAVRAGLVLRRHLVEVVHADDAHERAERQGPHAVLGLAAAEAPQAGTEAEEELGGLHPGHPGRDEVARSRAGRPRSMMPTTNTNIQMLTNASHDEQAEDDEPGEDARGQRRRRRPRSARRRAR